MKINSRNQPNQYSKKNVRIIIFIKIFIFLGEHQEHEDLKRLLQSNTTQQGNQTNGSN